MINRKTLISAVLALTISISAGCTVVNKTEEPEKANIEESGKYDDGAEVDEVKQESIMKEYENIINKENAISEYIFFLNENIKYLSPDNASKFIIKAEEMQKENLTKLEEKYYESDIQVKLNETFKPEYDLANIKVNNVKDEKVRKLLEETINLGYKVETAEGTFFPIIDYSFYKKNAAYATSDIRAYIDIMAEESDKVPAKDAALVISWDELFQRSFNLEEFMSKHKDSAKFEEVSVLYNKYLNFAIYGLNNTPLFNYEDNKINADAKAAYEKAIGKESRLSQVLKEYYQLIEKNGFELNDSIRSYRDDLVKNMK